MTLLPGEGPLRVLVVDDSAFTRRSIAGILSASPNVQVVAKAADGDEALRLVGLHRPDVITLDLEMPRMDGFTFLRILMARSPLPVIVISGYSHKENVFRALELGALDFVAKPDRASDAELSGIEQELLQKIAVARRAVRLGQKITPEAGAVRQDVAKTVVPTDEPQRIIAIGSSTGGPTALAEILSKVGGNYPHAVLIAQHMPDKFTRTFAERLDRRSGLRVREAQDRDPVLAGTALLCPGRFSMELERARTGAGLTLRVVSPGSTDRYAPSVDRLLASVARVAGDRAVGVILTGMGDDGAKGAKAIRDAGGFVVAESRSTAIIYGMPGSAVRAGAVHKSLALHDIASWLAELETRPTGS